MVAILTRIFGVENLTLAEDVVQEALARALQTWPFYGIPENPAAWIMRASRNLARDTVRRQKVFREKQPEIIRIMDPPGATAEQSIFSEEEIAADRFRMMLVCWHPLDVNLNRAPDDKPAADARFAGAHASKCSPDPGSGGPRRQSSPAEGTGSWAMEPGDDRGRHYASGEIRGG